MLKDYDYIVEYHLGKANVVVDTQSRKSMIDLRMMFSRLSLTGDGDFLAELQLRPTLVDEILLKQSLDMSVVPRFTQIEKGKTIDFELNSKGVLCFRGRYCMLDDRDLSQSILQKSHSSTYTLHPRGNKIY